MARQERYKVDFVVQLAWQDANGLSRRASGRCVDLSAAGVRIETKDHFPPRTLVVVTSDLFGRMGNATIRYAKRVGMKYQVGLQFSVLLQLSDPVRRKMLEKVTTGKPLNPEGDQFSDPASDPA